MVLLQLSNCINMDTIASQHLTINIERHKRLFLLDVNMAEHHLADWADIGAGSVLLYEAHSCHKTA